MRKKLIKIMVDFEKEERWLNKMAAQGLALVNYTFLTYTFEACEPGEYIYRIEYFGKSANSAEGESYISFLEEASVEHVCNYTHWIYFRRKATEGPFDLYSDIDSKLAHYKKILTFWGMLLVAEILFAFSNFHLALDHESFLLSPNFMIFCPLAILAVVIFMAWRRLYKKYKHLQQKQVVNES